MTPEWGVTIRRACAKGDRVHDNGEDNFKCPELLECLNTMYMEPAPMTPDAFGKYMSEELQRWSPLIKRLNLVEG